MNIIFGKEQAQVLANTHTVLELDTFQFGVDGPVIPAYCVVDTISFSDMLNLEQTCQRHQQLIAAYQAREWKLVLDLVDTLTGVCKGEVDSFYQEIKDRVLQFQNNEPDSSWSHVIIKQVS